MKKFGKISKRVLSFTLAVLMTVSCLPAAFMFTKAEDEPAPAHSKTIIPNGDGTYTIVLDVTGSTSSQTNYSKINVLVVFDVSYSMTYSAGYKYTASSSNSQTMYGLVDGKYVELTRSSEYVYFYNSSQYTGQRYTRSGSFGNYTYSPSDGTNQTMYGLVNGNYVQLTRNTVYHYSYNGNPYTGTRYTRTAASEKRLAVAKDAVINLATDLLSLNNADGINNTEDDNIVEMGLITFGTSVTSTSGKTHDLTTFKNTVNSISIGNGTPRTNWEAALKAAGNYSFSTDKIVDTDPTYVIFISDGNPTKYGSGGNSEGDGGEGDSNISTCFEKAKDDAKAIVDNPNLTFYAIGIFGDTDRMQDLVDYAYNTTNSEYCFFAENAEELSDALDDIQSSIAYSGFGSVEIDDGTTESVKTASGTVANMLNVDTGSFKYYRSGGKYGSKNYAGGNYGTAWSDAPKAEYVISEADGTSTIEWDLSSINAVEENESAKGMLENGVTYTMTAVCAPSQDTYDLIATLKNNDVHTKDGITYGELSNSLKGFFKADTEADKVVVYDDLDENVKECLDSNYKLKTNTEATLSYTIDGVPADPVYFDAPGSVDTDATSVSINKKWVNDLDTRTITEIGISVLCDGAKYTNVVLKSETSWTDSINIAPGLLLKNADGSVTVWNAGHDYTVEEYTPGTTATPADYHWEPVVEVYHPMIIGQKLVMLLQTDAPEEATGNYYKDDSGKENYMLSEGKWYAEGESSAFAINITNERRSNLNITKVLNLENGEIAAEHAKFEFTITIENSNAENDPANDGVLWFSVYDEAGKVVENLTVSGNVTASTGGYYVVDSGAEFTVELEAGWNLRFTNLPTGTYYSIEESDMPEGFEYDSATVVCGNNSVKEAEDDTADISADSPVVAGTLNESNMLYTVTLANKLASYNKTRVTVEKVWEDDNDRDRKQPASGEITAALKLVYKDGSEQVIDGAIVLKKSENWTKVFDNLPLYDKDGNKIGTTSAADSYYTAVEVTDLSPDYTSAAATVSEKTDTGIEYTVTLTNTHKIATTSVSVEKIWNDDNDRDRKRPDTVTIKLLADNAETGKTFVVKKDDSGDALKHTWTDLPVYADGKVIKYTVSEDASEGYSVNYGGDAEKGFTVTNSYTPGKTSVTVTKVWDDDNDRDGLRTSAVKVQLLANNNKVEGAIAELSEKNSWKYTFENLNLKDAGIEIVYTVEEIEVPEGYKESYSGDAKSGLKVTNTHAPEVSSITVVKEWNDNNNQDGKRDEIEFTLYANGTFVDAKTLAKDDRSVVFENVKVNDAGKPIVYTVKETKIPAGYTSSASDAQEIKDGSLTVTNTHTPETREITAEKVWNDNGNQDGKRGEIEFTLYADGKAVENSAKTLAVGTESATWKELPVYNNGKGITYTVKETKVPDEYTSSTASENAEVDEDGKATITNTHEVAKTSVTVTKVWEDNDNQDNKRPASVTVRLLADGTEVANKTITAAENWKWTFDDLDEFKAGKKIVYTITEDTVENYTSKIDGFTVTNSYTPGKTSVTVTKVWEDNDNQDGIRPASVTVKLLADGADTGKTVVLGKDNRWTDVFDGLDEYKAGKKIEYTIAEVTVEGYETKITGDAAKGFTVTNTHTSIEADPIKVDKIWDDDNNRDGKRPGKITVRLYADGVEVAFREVTLVNGGWKCEFTGFPMYRPEGILIKYEIREDPVEEYSTEITGSAADGFVITNSYTPGKTSVKVVKVWDDVDNEVGIRDDIGVTLYANGVQVGNEVKISCEVNEYTWTDLPEYENGVKIVYSVKETTVPEFYTESTAEANAEVVDGVATITNLLELDGPIDDPIPLTGLIKFKMQKEWLDLPGTEVKHDEIQVKIYRDGKHLTTATLNEESGWIYEWSANKEYTWTYEEVAVPGYESTVKTEKISNKEYSVVITNKADGYDNPDTGDNTALFGAIAGAAAALGMAFIPGKIRRRREDE